MQLELFWELVDEENKIVSVTEMDKNAIAAINKNKIKYFDEDRASIYNSLKTDIRES